MGFKRISNIECKLVDLYGNMIANSVEIEPKDKGPRLTDKEGLFSFSIRLALRHVPLRGLYYNIKQLV